MKFNFLKGENIYYELIFLRWKIWQRAISRNYWKIRTKSVTVETWCGTKTPWMSSGGKSNQMFYLSKSIITTEQKHYDKLRLCIKSYKMPNKIHLAISQCVGFNPQLFRVQVPQNHQYLSKCTRAIFYHCVSLCVWITFKQPSLPYIEGEE